MWIHRAFAKAIIRQKRIKMTATEQLIFLLICDHANDDNHQTYFTIARLAEMTQTSADTVRRALKKLQKEELMGVYYSPGRAPIFTVYLPKGFKAQSDTDISTIGKAHPMSQMERAEQAIEAFLKLTGVSSEQLHMMVFTGLDGIPPEEARELVTSMCLENPDGLSPAKSILTELATSLNSEYATAEYEEIVELKRLREEEAEARDKLIMRGVKLWKEGKGTESYEEQARRIAHGWQDDFTDAEMINFQGWQHTALGR